MDCIVITWCIWVQSNLFGVFEQKKAKKIQNLYKVKCSWFECFHCKRLVKSKRQYMNWLNIIFSNKNLTVNCAKPNCQVCNIHKFELNLLLKSPPFWISIKVHPYLEINAQIWYFNFLNMVLISLIDLIRITEWVCYLDEQ